MSWLECNYPDQLTYNFAGCRQHSTIKSPFRATKLADWCKTVITSALFGEDIRVTRRAHKTDPGETRRLDKVVE